MIFGIDYSDALCGFMVIWLAVIAGLWIREIVKMKRREWELSRARLFHCRNCHLSFLDTEYGDGNMTRCPRCNTVCLRRRNR